MIKKVKLNQFIYKIQQAKSIFIIYIAKDLNLVEDVKLTKDMNFL